MPPAAIKREDGLVALLLERLDRFETSLSAVQQSLVRFEEAEKQAHATIAQAQARADRLEGRVSALEVVRQRAEGAAWLGKAIWGVVLLMAGAVLHYVAGR